MAKSEEKFHKRRLRSSYLSVVISITLVLFILGVFGTLVMKADSMRNKMLEEYAFTVMLKNDAQEADIRQFQKELEISEKVVSTEFITKDEAAEELEELLGEEFVDFLGSNPLSDAIEIKMQANFVNMNDVEAFSAELKENPVVSDVVYDPDFVELMNAFVRKIGSGLLIASILLILVSIALINSSIRLSIYSKRFTIKTMQLVGATKAFIQRPFMKNSLQLGVVGGVLSSAMLVAGVYFGKAELWQVGLVYSPLELALICGGMIVFGTLLVWGCTIFAVSRYLNLKTDDLYN
ncbi:cell division protein FtsX [Phaeocystidibacter luteus]|uniref:Cell division protein FtsX n=1 Tax=Phaeocystidibacter luteus TaxID=911197 RepID=A0A6N6RH77_9FLAO|nr:permease-like cell division protein FtsX [Phaeocystidibacter luteus]KAB2813716.1 ABC transporter permease [Phaeocystidibacter luteus]